MVDLEMAEIFNFSTVDEKNELQKFEPQKKIIKDKITGKVDNDIVRRILRKF